jgi:hypothetical protein
MIYLIPKCFNNKKDFIERCFQYLHSIEKLNIVFNPKKSIYPRLKDTKKRGKNALVEILNNLNPSYFSNEKEPDGELILILKWGLRKVEIKGIQVLAVKNITPEIFASNYFQLAEWSHIPETETDLLNVKIDIMSQNLLEKQCVVEEVNAVAIIKSHLDNYIFSQEDKLELIKIILNN